MPDKKVISIILEEVRSVPKRCRSYHDTLLESISDILEYERQHRVQGTNIQQKVNDKCSAAGRYLADKRGDTVTDEDERQ